MADHFAIQLRDALVTAVTGLATTGARVYTAHTRDDALVYSAALPGLVVLTPIEDVSLADAGALIYQRTATIAIMCVAEKTAALQDLGEQVYQMAKEVEIALAAPLTVASRQVQLALSGAIDTESSEQGDRLVAMLTLPMQALYFTTAGVPDVHA